MASGDNKKIVINSVVIFFRLCIVSVVSLVSSRLVLDALGNSDFGLYNVVGGIVTFLNIMNTAMLSTTYRYIAFEIGKKEEGDPNLVFNASLLIHALFAILLFVIGSIIGEWYIHNYLNVAQDKIPDAIFVFRISLLTASASTLFVPFMGLLVAYEKFIVNALIDIVGSLLIIGLIVSFIYSTGNRIRLYSLLVLTSSIVTNLLYFFYCFKKHKDVVRLKLCKTWKLYKEMLSFAWWTLFGAIAIIGKAQGSKILINFFFGTIVNAAYAVASQIESFVLTFARSLSNAAVPQITKNFSGGNTDRSILLTSYISKYTFLLMCFIAFPLMLEMDFLLDLWLIDVPDGATIFCKLIVLNCLLSCLGEGIPALVNATGNIKIYQIVYQTINFLGLPIAFIVFKMGYGQNSILIVYCIITFLCAFVRLFLLKRIYKFDISLLIKTSYLRILIVSLPLIVFYCFYSNDSQSWLAHLGGIALSEVILIMVILILGLDSKERALVKSVTNKYIKTAA